MRGDSLKLTLFSLLVYSESKSFCSSGSGEWPPEGRDPFLRQLVPSGALPEWIGITTTSVGLMLGTL